MGLVLLRADDDGVLLTVVVQMPMISKPPEIFSGVMLLGFISVNPPVLLLTTWLCLGALDLLKAVLTLPSEFLTGSSLLGVLQMSNKVSPISRKEEWLTENLKHKASRVFLFNLFCSTTLRSQDAASSSLFHPEDFNVLLRFWKPVYLYSCD